MGKTTLCNTIMGIVPAMDGSVKLGAAAGAEDPKVLVVPILDPLGPGTYTVSWTAAPLEDHGVRGRFRFTVAAAD